MTEEELDKARAEEAERISGDAYAMPYGEWVKSGEPERDKTVIAARLAREGWMPTDPDWDEAEGLGRRWGSSSSRDLILAAIKRGRELERTANG